MSYPSPENEFEFLRHAEAAVNDATNPVVVELGELAVPGGIVATVSDEDIAYELATLSAAVLMEETQTFVNAKHDFDEANATRRRSAENRKWLRAKLAERTHKSS